MVSPHIIDVVAQFAVAGTMRPKLAQGLLPGIPELGRALTETPANWGPFIGSYIERDILPYLDPNQSEVHLWLPKLMRKVTGFAPLPAVSLPKEFGPAFEVLEYKLYSTKKDEGSAPDNDIVRGHAIAERYKASNALPAMTSQGDAVRTVRELRAFEGLLIRIAGAIAAARELAIVQQSPQVTGSHMSTALALYRNEGDLVAPSSHTSLLDSLPPIERWLKYRLKITRKKVNLKVPNMSMGVWLTTVKDFDDRVFGDSGRPANMEEWEWKFWARVHAIMDWMVVIVGYDYLMGKWAFKTDMESRLAFREQSSKIWESALPRGGTAGSDAGARFVALLDNLVVHPVSPTVVWVAPLDPSLLVGTILSEGLMFMYSNLRDTSGDIAYLTADLRYLHYHAQAKYSHAVNEVADDEFRKILVSALIAARKTGNAELKALLSDQTKFPAAVWPKGRRVEPAQYQAIWNAVRNAGWSDTEMAHWRSFVTTAGEAEWSSWPEHRANFSRYRGIVHYYEHITA